MSELIPNYLSDRLYRVVAWLPANNELGEYAAVVFRHDPECAGAPYAVWRVRRDPGKAGLPGDAPQAWRLDLGMYDLETLREAVEVALEGADWLPAT